MFPYDPPEAWHRSRIISIAIIIFALLAVPIGLADPHATDSSASAAHTTVQRQRDRTVATAGVPVAPHPNAPPRGLGG
jgi:hypothetical protein